MNRKRPIPTPFQQKSTTQDRLKEILDFGPDSDANASALSSRVNDRIRELVKKLQELNRRVDKLNTRY